MLRGPLRPCHSPSVQHVGQPATIPAMDERPGGTSHHLKPIGVAGVDGRIDLGDTTTLGRAPSNTVPLQGSAYPNVSSHHARISLVAEGAVLEDLGSTHGIRVNWIFTKKCQLKDGDILELGENGPRFVYETRSPDQVTGPVQLPRGAVGRPELTRSTILRVKKELGVPEEQDVGSMLHQTDRRSRGRVLKVAFVLAACVLGAWYVLQRNQEVELQRLAAANDRVNALLEQAGKSFESQLSTWEVQKQQLLASRDELEKQLKILSASVPASDATLVKLQEQLSATQERLQRFDPVNVERARQDDIDRIRKTVACIEVSMRLKDPATGKYLRRVGLNYSLGDEGTVLEQAVGSGTGFCVTNDGRLLTNAHVVDMTAHTQPVETPVGQLQQEWVYNVVFSGTDVRHPATVEKMLGNNQNDIALVRIKPFEGMPVVASLNLEVARPKVGAEVYLHGFPLGKEAVQDGVTVHASSFRGILSRNLEDWMQVDAAVHPGNSGGPVTDSQGNVIGIVTRVQLIGGEAIAPDMGYVIPIANAKRLMDAVATQQAGAQVESAVETKK